MVPELLSPIHDDSADVVVGTRENHADGSGIRIILGKLVKSYFSTIAAWITRGGTPKDVNSGFFCNNNADTPEICGAAKLVPLEIL